MRPRPIFLGGLCSALFLAPTLATAQDDPTPDQVLTWKDLLGTSNTFEIYGFLRLDAMYDDSRFNDPLIPFAVLSEDGSPPGGVPAGIVADEDDSEFDLSARLTRLGLRFERPKPIDGLGDPTLGGVLEVDFYNIDLGDSDSRNALRMRLAYLKLTWDEWSLLAGQNWDVISPLYPAVNADLVMWGAGNTGDRRPQLTVKNEHPLGGGKLISELGIGLTGAVGGTTVSGGLKSGEDSGRPMVHARVGYHGKTESGGAYQLGVWGHDSEEDFDATGAGKETYDSNSVGVDFRAPLVAADLWIMGEWWTGQNLRDVRGGILQGVNPTTGDEISADGGFVELGWQATEACSLYAGYSYDDPDDGDLDTFQRSKNEVPYLAARWRFGDLRLGLEYLNWTTEYIGLESGDANRLVGYIAYYF
jgi:hypothetical protein